MPERFEEIERIPDRDRRIEAYAEYVRLHAANERAWNNLAVDLAAAGRYVEARRASLTELVLDPQEQGASAACKALRRIGDLSLDAELVATDSHLVYRATGPQGRVLLRALVDCDPGDAVEWLARYEGRWRLGAITGLARPAQTVRASEGTVFQVLEDVPGRSLLERCQIGLDRETALAILEELAEAVGHSEAAGMSSIELRPEYVLISDTAPVTVTLLGPQGRGGGGWRAPEEEDERGGAIATGPAGDVYRLGLLCLAMLRRRPTPLAPTQLRAAIAEVAADDDRLAELLELALAAEPAARSTAATWREQVAKVRRGAAPALPALVEPRLLRELGRGPLETVYEAQTSDGKHVAVRVLRSSLRDTDGAREAFFEQAQRVGALEHPHLLRVFERGHSAGCHYLVMELASGGSLEELLRQVRRMSANEATDLGIQAARALGAAHQLPDGGVLHLALGPAKILYREPKGTRIAVAGFGVSQLYGDPTAHGRSAGAALRPLSAVAYLAPEQVKGEPLTASTDVYALGAILYECLAGKVPFSGGNEQEILQSHLSTEPPPLAGLGVPRALAKIVHSMLAREPKERPATMAEVIELLQGWPELDARAREQAEREQKEQAERERKEQAERERKEQAEREQNAREARARRRRRLIALGLAGGAALVVALVLIIKPEPPPPTPPALTVEVSGAGRGQVTSEPDGLAVVSGRGQARWPRGQEVDLIAEPARGSVFAGWGGACAGTEPRCTLSLSADATVTAAFAPEARAHVTVRVVGQGHVRGLGSEPCSSECVQDVALGRLTLRAVASPGWALASWSASSCAPGSATCTLAVSGATVVVVTFATSQPKVAIEVSLQGRGTVAVGGEAPCSSECTRQSPRGAPLLLQATPEPGWEFSRWGGACAGQPASCRLTPQSPVLALAVFRSRPTVRLEVSAEDGAGAVLTDADDANVGKVVSEPPGLACPPSCRAELPAGAVTLTSTMTTPPVWSNGCVGATCRVTLTEPTRIVVGYRPPRLGVTLVGKGRVELLEPRGVLDERSRALRLPVPYGTEVVMRAVPPAGYRRVAWSDQGACGPPREAPAECRVKMVRDVSLVVRFLP